MKKIFKVFILVLLVYVLLGIQNPELKHEHIYVDELYEATETSVGYTLHTCECGYSYKDNYVDVLSNNIYINVQRNIEEEKNKRKFIYAECKANVITEVPDVDYINYNEKVYEPIDQDEKIFIVYMRFKVSL